MYQVELAGHGSCATLVARPHALFRNFHPGYRSTTFALNDHHVVEIWEEDDEESMGFNINKEIKVYRYSEALVGPGQPEYSSIKPVVHQLKGLLCTVR